MLKLLLAHVVFCFWKHRFISYHSVYQKPVLKAAYVNKKGTRQLQFYLYIAKKQAFDKNNYYACKYKTFRFIGLFRYKLNPLVVRCGLAKYRFTLSDSCQSLCHLNSWLSMVSINIVYTYLTNFSTRYLMMRKVYTNAAGIK